MPRKDRRGRIRGFLASLTQEELQGALKVLEHYIEMADSSVKSMLQAVRISPEDFLKRNLDYYSHALSYLLWMRPQLRRHMPTESCAQREELDNGEQQQ